jgi:hypothetical protein
MHRRSTFRTRWRTCRRHIAKKPEYSTAASVKARKWKSRSRRSREVKSPDRRSNAALRSSTTLQYTRITVRWRLDLIQLNPPSHISSILAAGLNFVTSPNLETSPPARQRRLGKDRRLSMQTSFSALHEPSQPSRLRSCIPSVWQTSSCIART